jgi:hypothetical protein
MPAEVVLAAVVSLGPPVDCAFVMLVGDGWVGGTAATRSLAFRDISGGCGISLVATLSLSSFGGPGHPLNMAAIGDHDGGSFFSLLSLFFLPLMLPFLGVFSLAGSFRCLFFLFGLSSRFMLLG